MTERPEEVAEEAPQTAETVEPSAEPVAPVVDAAAEPPVEPVPDGAEAEAPEPTAEDVPDTAVQQADGAESDAVVAPEAPSAPEVPATDAGRESVEPAAVEPVAAQPPTILPAHPVAITASAPWWPFAVYGAAWAGFVGYLAWTLMQVPADVAVFQSETYPILLFVGIALVLCAPALAIVVWLTMRGRPETDGTAVLLSALLRAAGVALFGTVAWWAVLIITDVVRLGRPL